MRSKRIPNSSSRAAMAVILAVFATCCGCFSPWFRGPNDLETRRETIREKLQSDERPRIISQIGSDRMLTLGRLENVGIVNLLPGTGGTVKASQPREKILDAMRRRDVDQPNTFLDSESTAMVVAFAVVPPAANRGARLDANVKLSAHAEATDLQRGWLMETPLVEMRREQGQIREGFEFAAAQGPVVTRAQMFGGDSLDDKLEGIVVGGVRLMKSRELGIGISSEYADAITMAAIIPAINSRFTVFDGRKQVGIATPKDDRNIDLVVPSKYKLDPFHFVNVVLNLGFHETEQQRQERIDTLRKQLAEPITVRTACWQLEALGEQSIPILVENLSNPDPEIRFYTAHSLAYLDDSRAIAPLVELCRREPAFRAMCLHALTQMEGYEAVDALEQLMHSADAETRYGAVRGLRYRDASDPRVTGQIVPEVGSILEVPSSGPPLVAVSLHETPEVVIFGSVPQLSLPVFQYVNPRTIIQPNADGSLSISSFEPGKEDRVIQVAADLRSVLLGIAEVGGGYGDWVSFLRECNQAGYMSEPFAMNPIPSAGRTYNRLTNSEVDPSEQLYDEVLINSIQEPQEEKDRNWYNPFTW